MVDSLNEVCNKNTNDYLEPDIKFKLLNLHKKVKQTNKTWKIFLNDLSNMETKTVG